MGTIRVTQGLLVDRTLNNLNSQLRRILVLQEQLSTGLRVNRPSDDPIDARRAVNARQLIQQNEQYLSNVSNAGPLLTETTSELQQVADIIHRVKELTLQGASETNGQQQLDSIALEINQLLEAVVVASNHETNGRYIFAGTRTTQPAYSLTRVAGDITAVAYDGNAEEIQLAIAAGVRVTVNEPGSQAFQSAVDIFQTLIGIRDDLRAGDQASLQNTRIAELDQALDQVLLAEARVGAVQNRLERVSQATDEYVVQLQEVLSDRIEADLADTVIQLNAQQNALQAALQSAARVLQPSLLDFVR